MLGINLRGGLIEILRLLGLYTVLRYVKNLSSRNLESHGQTGEDRIISKFFLNEDFTYIDIGSGEPILRSNSYLFYKAGKSGILVDPLRSNKILSVMIRPRDTFIQSLVGISPGVRTFWEFHDYEYSSMDGEVVSELVQSGKARIKSTKNVEVMTLSKVVEQLKSPNIPWFLSVDVEGADLEVIKSYDFLQNRPRLICIEDHVYVNRGSSVQHEYLTNLNYTLVDQTTLSLIYLDTQ
jgi:FkbM family methyltransferase